MTQPGLRSLAGWPLCMACYGAALGGMLMVNGYPIGQGYGIVFASLGLTATAVGASLLALFSTVGLTFIAGNPTHRAAAAAACALLWALFGVVRLAAGFEVGSTFAVWGIFEIIGGVGCSYATIEWSRQA